MNITNPLANVEPPGELESPSAFRERALATCLLVLGFLATVICARLDPLGVVHADDLTHYLFARWAWRWPAYLLNEWGRPGFTALYFLPAGLGWPACRILSALLFVGSAALAYQIARRMGLRNAWMVILLCYIQPLFFKLSQTTLTETPLAFYLTAAVYLVHRGRWATSSAILSLGFITRHEAVLFLPIWFLAARADRVRMTRLWPLLWAPLVVNLLGLLVGYESIVSRLLHPVPTTQYGQGGWLTFFARSMEAWGPGVTMLALAGLGRLRRRSGGGLVVGSIVIWFVCQTAIRALGFYGSGGYARFLVPVSPLVAIAAAQGWQRLWSVNRSENRRAALTAAAALVLLWIAMERQLVLYAQHRDEIAELPEIHQAKIAVRIATVTVVLIAGVVLSMSSLKLNDPVRLRGWHVLMPGAVAVLILLTTYRLCRPLEAPADARLTERTLAELRRRGLDDRKIISASIWMEYLSGRESAPDRPSVRRELEDAPLGSLFVWEKQFAGSDDHRIPLWSLTEQPSMKLIYESPPVPYQKEPYMRVFEKIGPWRPQPEGGKGI